MTAEPTVIVVDDNPGVRKSLQALLTSVGLPVKTYASAQEFLHAFDPEQPGCLVLDVRLRDRNGLEVQEEIARQKAQVPIIFITSYGNVPTAVRALKGGAIDFLQKPYSAQELLDRIQQALEIDRQARAEAAARATVAQRMQRLTPRQREVMERLIAGKSSKAIAAELKLSVRTVEAYRASIFETMGVNSAAALVRVVLLGQGDT